MGTTAHAQDDIVATDAGSNREPHPMGQFPAVCCDVVDMGMVDKTWAGETKKVRKIRIAFLTNRKNDEGQPLMVSAFFTLSMSEKANLRKFMEQWRGRPYTPQQIKDGVAVNRMVGVPALIQITHNDKGDRVYDNISSIMMLPEGMTAPTIPDTYVRVKDRPKDGKGKQPQGAQQGTHRPDAAQRHAEVNANARAAQLAKEAHPEFEDFPGALEDDEDDQLPF